MSAAFKLSSLKPPGVPARANKRTPAVDAAEDVEAAPLVTPRKEGPQPNPCAALYPCICTLLGAVHQHFPPYDIRPYAGQRKLSVTHRPATRGLPSQGLVSQITAQDSVTLTICGWIHWSRHLWH